MSLYVYRCPECPSWAPKVALDSRPPVVAPAPWCLAHAVPFPMVSVEDHETLALPVDPPLRGELVPAKVGELRAAGFLLPETQDALDWLWRNRASNGYAPAFLKVGGRRCIDLVAFARITRERQA